MTSFNGKHRLIITLQLKNAEVYPGSNLYGTIILQLINKHHYSNSIKINDKKNTSNNNGNNNDGRGYIKIDKMSLSVVGKCIINSNDISHFPNHLKNENNNFNILKGKENILDKNIKIFIDNINDSNNSNTNSNNNKMQFDFIVQLPMFIPCSFHGYFIQYYYYTQLYIYYNNKISKCKVSFYVLPLLSNNNDIPKVLTPLNLQERMSIFRKANNLDNKNNQYNRFNYDITNQSNKIENITTKNGRESVSLSYDYNFNLRNNNNYEIFCIKTNNILIGQLLLNNTNFCDGEYISGFLHLNIPCIINITLKHIEICNKQTNETNCSSHNNICWYNNYTTFQLKIPNNAFKSFISDIIISKWFLNFKFFLNKNIMLSSSKTDINPTTNNNVGYINKDFDIWSLSEDSKLLSKKNNNNNNNNNDIKIKSSNETEINKTLNWDLPINVVIKHKALRCVTRSSAVIIKC